MMLNNILHLVTNRQWMVEEMQSTSWDIRHSWGLDLPEHSPDDSWWLSQAYAIILQNTLQQTQQQQVKFTAPKPDMLDRTPKQYTMRTVQTVTAAEAAHTLVEWEPGLWWKLATAKNERFPAEPRTHQQLMLLIQELKLPGETLLQVSTPLPEILSEHRFFVATRRRKPRIMASSGYLLGGEVEENQSVYPEHHKKQAASLVTEWLHETPELLPPGFVVDVAVTEEGAAILEFNPAWCSGWYEADREQVLNTVRRSVHPTSREYEEWMWVPDPSMTAVYGNRVMYHSK